MAVFYTEEQIVTAVGRLTRVQLVHYVEADVIRPVATAEGPRFRPADVARLEFICDLTEQYDLEDDAIGVILSLTDQLHDMRADFEALAETVAHESREVRARIAAAFLDRRRG